MKGRLVSLILNLNLILFFKDHDRQYMHIGTLVEFAFALVGKLDVINKHSFNDFRLRVGKEDECPSRITDGLYNRSVEVLQPEGVDQFSITAQLW